MLRSSGILVILIFFPELIASPTDLLNVTSKDDKVFIKWFVEEGIDGYNILRSEDKDKEYVQLNPYMIVPTDTDIDKNKEMIYTDSNVTGGILYFYKIEKINKKGESILIGPISIKVPLNIL